MLRYVKIESVQMPGPVNSITVSMNFDFSSLRALRFKVFSVIDATISGLDGLACL